MRRAANLTTTVVLAVVALAVLHTGAIAQCECRLPDNGAGTVTMPPDCPDGYVSDLEIVDGLVGATIQISGTLFDFINVVENIGGGLGGTQSNFDATLRMEMFGTGALAGFARTIHVPVSGLVDWGPRTLNDPVQAFTAQVHDLSGSIFGDPDFDELHFRHGSLYALPGLGSTTLTRVGGVGADFLVDSFFDITYEIEFLGAPGSVLEFQGGTTQRMTTLNVCPVTSPVEESSWATIKALYR